MAIAEEKSASSDAKGWSLFRLPFKQSGNSQSSSSSSITTSDNSTHHHIHHLYGQTNQQSDGSNVNSSNSVSSVARSLLPTRRRLRLDPANKLYFPCTSFTSCLVDFFIFPNLSLASFVFFLRAVVGAFFIDLVPLVWFHLPVADPCLLQRQFVCFLFFFVQLGVIWIASFAIIWLLTSLKLMLFFF